MNVATSNRLSESTRTMSSLAEVLNLFIEGETNIVLSDNRDVIVMLGITGSGKSTLTQFIAGGDSQLVATRKQGNFLIEDGNKRIGTSTITSKTIFPELVVDPRTNTAFYDCPGFSDTRSSVHDIAASYFIKRVLDHTQRVKMLFTINHSSVQAGNDRRGFVDLLTHACHLVGDVDKFAKSIMIVVTKVRNDYEYDEDDVSTIVPDNVVIDNIAGFMRDVRRTLAMSNNTSDETRSFHSCAIKLIDIFVDKVGDTYTRIGIFRRPIKAGPLSKSTLLMDGRRNIETILTEHTTYTDKSKDDFNYTISDTSKQWITNYLNQELNEETMALLARLADNMEAKLIDECVRSTDMYALKSRLETVGNSLRQLTAENQFETPNEFIDQVKTSMEIVGANSKDMLTNITRQIGYLEDFHAFTKSRGEYFSTTLGSQKFLQTREFVRKLNDWYVSLLELYDKHSNYPYQTHKNRFSKSDLIDGGNNEKMFDLNHTNVHRFLENVANYSVHNSFSIVDDERIRGVALSDLNDVMNLAYKQYTSSCEEALVSSLEDLIKEIEEEYLQKCTNFANMIDLVQNLRLASDSLQRITQTGITTVHWFKIELMNTLEEVGISDQSTSLHIDNLLNHHQLYESFTRGVNATDSDKPPHWSTILKPATEYIRSLASWYESILRVQAELTEKSCGLKIDTVQWVVNPGQSIDETNMHSFLIHTKLPAYDPLLNDTDTVVVLLKDLNNILHLATTLAQSCERSIVSDLETLRIAIETKYISQCDESHNMHSLQKALDLGYNITQRLAETNLPDASDFINQLFNACQEMSVPVTRTMALRMTKRTKHLQHLKRYNISNTKLFDSREWASVFSAAKDHIFSLNNWYTFLLDLHRKLSGYTYQKYKTKYNVKDISNWGVSGQTQRIDIDKSNVRAFLEKVKNLNLAGVESINATKVEGAVFRDLNKILDLTLRNDPSVSESGGVLTIQGQYVVISEFPELLHPNKYNSVQVFALDTVFIDADIQRIGKDFQLTIIAPTWDVQGSRKIDLTGAAGLPLKPPKAKGGSIFGNTPNKAARGEDGKPGNPGSPGGSFFGVGLVFLRGGQLEMTSRGGKGGPGQDGGGGRDGIKQVEINEDDVIQGISSASRIQTYSGSPGRFKVHIKEQHEKSSMQGAGQSFVSVRWTIYDLEVSPLVVGSKGGDGGRGGVGGMGGHGGEVSIISLDRKSGIVTNTSRDPGSEGVGGRGGEGGRGGYTPGNWAVKFTSGTRPQVVNRLSGHQLSRGLQGKDNSITNDRLQPERAQKTTKSKYINMFKRYSWSSLNNVATFEPLTTYLETLKRNVELRSTYDILSYAEELKYLELVNPTDNNVDLTIYYRYILESLDSYVKLSSQVTPEERRVLKYVYTAALSRICRTRARSDRSLITNLSRFLDQAKTNLPKLADLSRYQQIDEINYNYKKNIEIKIKEANDFINKHAMTEIDDVVEELEMNILALQNETRVLKQNAYAHKTAVLEYERKLANAIIMKRLFSVLNLASSVMPMVASATKEVIAPLLGAANAFADSTSDSVEVNPPKTPTYPQALKDTILDMTMDSDERKLARFIVLTDKMVAEIGADYSQLYQLKDKIIEIRSTLSNSGTRSLALARDDLKTALGSAGRDLQPDDLKGKEKLDTISTLFDDSDDSLNILAEYLATSDAESKGSAELKEAEEKIRQLEMYENQIHETFVPLLNYMHQSLTSIESKLANQSHVYLDVGRWEVQKCIRNVKHFIQQMTRGFHVGHKFMRTISKLEEVADLIINLYDRIEIYQDQKRMGDFISSINNVQVDAFKDSRLNSAMVDLQRVIISNTIFTQYSRALNAFKQQIFPFASEYSHLLNDGLSFGRDANISSLVLRAEEKLQLLIGIVSETESSVQSIRDSNLITSVFSSKYLTSKPFFTWGHQDFNEEINNLLTGEEVVLKAELSTDANTENAVKFSSVYLNIRTTSQGLQAGLDEAIRHFDVDMKHFGNSHYRCGERFYVMSGESQTFTRSFENYNSTEITPIRVNQVHNKIKAGDISLSPYAMWSLKLVNKTSGFETLNRFKGNVNLELSGEGQYVKPNADVCKSSLENYYNVYHD